MICPSIRAVHAPPVAPAGGHHDSVIAGETQERDGLSRWAKHRRGGRRGSGCAPVLAALDLGSNNCRLLIARPSADGGLRVVDSFSRIVRLGEGVAQTTGHRATDHLRTVALFEAALDVAEDVLKPGGAFVGKVFQGGASGELLARVKKLFREVKHVKPPASRSESVELYLVATGFRG